MVVCGSLFMLTLFFFLAKKIIWKTTIHKVLSSCDRISQIKNSVAVLEIRRRENHTRYDTQFCKAPLLSLCAKRWLIRVTTELFSAIFLK